ncbi:MAG: hypothetical protein JWN48_1170 [Myxococcaceae bacterium]|nr:hypothetical protein [Myxococcaceae bacterium]
MSQTLASVASTKPESSARPGSIARHRTASWTSLLALIGIVCFLDSAYVATRFDHGQWAADALMLVYFTWMYRGAPPRLRALMKYGVFIATVGESLFSLVLGMYEYRLENIPLYVPPGHAVMVGAVYYFVREPFVRRHAKAVCTAMLLASVAYAAYWLIAQHDLYGALCTALFVVLVAREAESRLFFLTMFWFVAILEQAGTRLGAWYWYDIAFEKFAWLPSGNPPSGISVFYFAFDVLCLIAYLKRKPELKARYRKLKQRPADNSQLNEEDRELATT